MYRSTHRISRPRRSCLPLALALVGLALTACTGDDMPGETTQDTPADSDSLVTLDTIGGSSTGDTATTAGSSDGTETTGPIDPSVGDECESKQDCEWNEKCESGYCEIDPLVCDTAEIEEEVYIPPNVVLVLDKSGSMVNPDNNWDDDADDADDDGIKDDEPGVEATPKVTRWRSLHEVVQVIGESFDSQINLGAQLFPAVDAQAVLGPQACVVMDTPEVSVAFENAEAVLSGIPLAGATDLAGGTPAEKGMSSAIAHLQSLPEQEMQDSYIILITDGAANCSTSAADDAELLNYDANLVPTISAALELGITTFVVGVDISNEVDAQGINAFEVLNDAAVAGGSPKDDPGEKFFNAVNKIELQEALDQIFQDEVLSCNILLSIPEGKLFEKIVIDGEEYPEPLPDGADCMTEDGWRYTDESETEIELCGAVCAGYQSSGDLELYYSCPPAG